ncbi:ATPase inhibitor mai-2, mitochondrial-like [Rhopilema esculentum]|uniref:ATPase inhibitor mai-2, mitochondrial-like n=1 Tax=Rhopilema esculentum TaxID=499914 RepID=UPI0031E1D151
MALSCRTARALTWRVFSAPLSRTMAGGLGEGAGRGGGSGGDIRSAGGAFGKMEAAREDQYFRRLQEDQLNSMKRQHQEQTIYHDEEITFHQAAIKRHMEAIERHKLLKTQSEAKIRQTEDLEKQQIINDKKK